MWTAQPSFNQFVIRTNGGAFGPVARPMCGGDLVIESNTQPSATGAGAWGKRWKEGGAVQSKALAAKESA